MMWCLMDFLAFMHSKGIMHRDLKPENILMSSKEKDASIRVVDFGTADFCAPNQRLFNKFGTVLYVAPEVRQGLSPYTLHCVLRKVCNHHMYMACWHMHS